MDTLVMEGCTKPTNIFESNRQQDSTTKIVNSDFADYLFPPSYSKVNSDENTDQESDFSDDCLKFISEILMEDDLDEQTVSFFDYTALQANSDENTDQASDFPDDCLKFISEILMEDDLDDQTVSFFDYTTLQATEKSLYDALAEVSPSSSESDLISDEGRGRKNLTRDDDIDYEEERKSKHLATYTEEYVEMEQYDDVILIFKEESCNSTKKKTRVLKKKKDRGGKVVDLMSILTQCAQAVGNFDLRNANELLEKIRCHASQHGDNTQRVAYYFSNALESRLAGTGWQQCRHNTSSRIPTSEVLKGYREQVSAIPFRRASYFAANDAIAKLTRTSTKIHIIDFGIFLGFQWPGLIHELSKRPAGPPMVRITGIDYPESGFRPSQRVEETGERLAGYCKRFNVPFEYQAIAKRWEDILLEELNIEKDEVVIVNCLYMSRKLVDETVEENNPRDSFLRLIRTMNPALFIHGIVNGTFSSPFFERRFKEALFHYSCVFDMFEATLPRESEGRLMVEKNLYGRDALNVIACEGAERVERPENYIQWQVRFERNGFRKVPIGYEAVKKVKDHVKEHYHKNFVVDEDGFWMFQGWKGRTLYALSCWKPV